MANHYLQRFDLSKYTLKTFDSVDEICFDTNNSDILTYNANGNQNAILSFLTVGTAGGDTGKGGGATVQALTGTTGVRQGAFNLQLQRQSTQPITATWDGNPDTALKVISRNFANNVSGGGVRAIDAQARNSGTNETWVKAFEFNGRNDSGKTLAADLTVLHIRAENYGTVTTSITGLDVEMSSENQTGSPVTSGIVVRNTDLSAQPAVQNVLLLSNTSTNGFTNFLNMSGLTASTDATLVSVSGSIPTNFSARIRVILPSGAPGWIPCYSTSNA